MPVTYWIDHEAKIIFTKIEGVVTDEDIITHQKQTRDNPELDPSYGQLIIYPTSRSLKSQHRPYMNSPV
ncbi:MAG: hypothetical protein P8Z42_02760 [Anaerolineales bacterium]